MAASSGLAGVGLLPTRLAAPAPSWERRVDVVVVGSGVAGLMVALTAAKVADVLVLTKGALDAGSTAWAQGGIAAAIDLADHPEAHYADTLRAGAGLCNSSAVRVLVEEGPQRLAQLISLGTAFDTDASGALSLTREGGHGRRRIVHAGGDATGYEVQRALMAAVHADARIEVIDHAIVLDLLRSAPAPDGQRRVAGVVASVPDPDGGEVTGRVEARAVVLASGGIGHVYASSTNPPVATGDGLALALRAGASVADLEFVQFHPTVLWQGPGAEGQQLLVSEAVRGEGAVLVDASGARVMAGVHPQGDLAPRDVVAKAMSVRMAQAVGGVDDHLWLDATGIGEAKLLQRFPTIVRRCRELGVDPAADLIPVAPGAHFACGGVRTDRRGRTDVAGLYAVGETACSGVHGAGSLAEQPARGARVRRSRRRPAGARPASRDRRRRRRRPAAGVVSARRRPSARRAPHESRRRCAAYRRRTRRRGHCARRASRCSRRTADPSRLGSHERPHRRQGHRRRGHDSHRESRLSLAGGSP